MWGKHSLSKVKQSSHGIRGFGKIITQMDRELNDIKNSQHDTEAVLPNVDTAFRKRPVKVRYDRKDYYKFYMPSEKSFLFSMFDREDIMGTRKNTQHSPHIRTQMDLDTKLLAFTVLLTVIMTLFNMKSFETYKILRQNHLNSELGKFSEDDFL